MAFIDLIADVNDPTPRRKHRRTQPPLCPCYSGSPLQCPEHNDAYTRHSRLDIRELERQRNMRIHVTARRLAERKGISLYDMDIDAKKRLLKLATFFVACVEDADRRLAGTHS